MIVAEKLSKNFQGVAAVKEVSFELERGRRLILLGTSGSGKTSTLRMLNRLTEPSSGDVWINGQSILLQNAEVLRRSIGYVMQHHGLFPHYTVEENISVVPKLLKWNRNDTHSRCVELLEKFQMPAKDFLHLTPDQLSGGQQQRVGLARALAADPELLLMDEPFGALDPLTRATIRKQLFEVDELKGKTIVLVTHDVHEAFELGDQICLMHQGEVMQQGPAIDLLFNPQSDFVRNFFDTHRLELELSILRIADLWQFLEGLPDSADAILFDADHRITDVLSHLAKADAFSVRIEHRDWNIRKTVDASIIFRALNAFRKFRSHE